MIKNIVLSKDHQFNLPNDLQVIPYLGKYIIISPNMANWIVAENIDQLNFFQLLRDRHTLDHALRLFSGDIEDAKWVVTQIIARDLERKTQKKTNIDNIHIYLTNACNLACPHCYMFSGEKLKDELTEEEIFNVLREFTRHGGKSVTFSGGEVRMRTDLKHIVKFGYDLGLEIEILTNGTLWNSEDIKYYSGLIKQIQISIDGYNEDDNSKIRGVGNFAKALNTAEEFLALGVRVEIACTPLFDPLLKDKIDYYANFGKSLITKYAGLPFSIKFNSEILDGRHLKLSDDERTWYTEVMTQINSLCYGDDSQDDWIIEMVKNHMVKDRCSYGGITLASNGDVYLCGVISKLQTITNIRKKSLKSIFKLSKEIIDLSNVDNLEPCRKCPFKYICGGDCKIKHFQILSNGHIGSEKFICSQKHKDNICDILIRTNKRLFE